MAASDKPDGIVLARDRDLAGRGWHPWLRRSLLAVVAAVPVLALFNVFGQRPSTARAASADAELEVSAPERVRAGVFYQGRFRVVARRELKEAILVLDRGWLEGVHVNTIEPSPIGEASRDGDLALELGHIRRGEEYVLYIQFQVNPTTVGRQSHDVELEDGDRPLLSVDRSFTVFP